MENENQNLKFLQKILELQLNTLKKKNEELLQKKNFVFLELKKEFAELIVERQKISCRLRRIYELFKEM